jgi:hypothetical protein
VAALPHDLSTVAASQWSYSDKRREGKVLHKLLVGGGGGEGDFDGEGAGGFLRRSGALRGEGTGGGLD